MSELEDYLKWHAEHGWGVIERFVLKHGRAFEAAPKPDDLDWGTQGQCYCNATQLALDGVGRYVEGYAYRPGLIPLSHAWLEIDGKAVDVTWKPDEGKPPIEYFGVSFDMRTLRRETFRNGFYGLLDTGRGVNLKLMEKIDPALIADVKEQAKRRFANVKA